MWRLERVRSGRRGDSVRNSERQRRTRSKEMPSSHRDQDYWTGVALAKRGWTMTRGCWSQAESTHGERSTGTRTNPKLIAVTFQVWSKRIYRCQKQSTIGRKEEGEGRSSRRRDHLIWRSKDRFLRDTGAINGGKSIKQINEIDARSCNIQRGRVSGKRR